MNPLWAELSSAGGVSFTNGQQSRLSRYLDLLLSARMNLTRITDRAQAEVLHIADSLTLLPFLPARPHRLADVGSGGGVPGIPLAIARPDVQVALIEARKKKASFLREAAADLQLGNVSVLAERAEDVGRGAEREQFDVAVARAVATLDWLAEYCLPLVKQGGVMLAMKGPGGAGELPAASKAIRLLGGGTPQLNSTGLQGAEGHCVVIISKVAHTDSRYPRSPSTAKKQSI